jgi:hypothetical protein
MGLQIQVLNGQASFSHLRLDGQLMGGDDEHEDDLGSDGKP